MVLMNVYVSIKWGKGSKVNTSCPIFNRAIYVFWKKASHFAKSEHTERSICWVFTTTLKAWVRPPLDCKQGTMSLPFLQTVPLTHPTFNEPMVDKIQCRAAPVKSQNREREQTLAHQCILHRGGFGSTNTSSSRFVKNLSHCSYITN